MNPLGWRKDYGTQQLCAEIEKRTLRGAAKGKGGWTVAFDGAPGVHFEPGVEEVLAVVAMALKWPKDISKERQMKALRTAVAKAALHGPVDEASLTMLLVKELRLKQGRPKMFFVAAELSTSSDVPLSSRRAGSTKARFTAKRSPNWSTSAIELNLKQVFPVGLRSDGYRHVAIEVLAYDAYDAYARSREFIDLPRALWNLYANVGTSREIRSGTPRPVNKIVWGPLTTVHRPDGTLATREFWYSPEYRAEAPKPYRPSDFGALVTFERWGRRRLTASPIRKQLETVLLAYVRALDEVDAKTAFLRLWSVFELLTGGLDGNYQRNVKRLVACYDVDAGTRRYLADELMYLKDFRNALVHEGTSKADEQLALWQLVGHVHVGIKTFLSLLYRQPTLDAAMACLDLPVDGNALKAHSARASLMRRLRKKS